MFHVNIKIPHRFHVRIEFLVHEKLLQKVLDREALNQFGYYYYYYYYFIFHFNSRDLIRNKLGFAIIETWGPIITIQLGGPEEVP